MKLVHIAKVAVAAAVLGISAADAQSLRESDGPAEFPPSSYKSAQYVDSTGCVFVRAGIGGTTSWVPRVTRSRKQVCGMKPSLAAPSAATQVAQAPAAKAPLAAPTDAPPAKAQSAPVSVVASAPTTPRKPQRVGPPMATIASTIGTPRRAPTVKALAQPVAATAPPPKAPMVVAAAKKAKPSPIMMTRSEACRQLSELGQVYINTASGLPVRCEPQTEDPVNVVRYSGDLTTTATSNPGAMAFRQDLGAASLPTAKMPAGYRAAWEDGRLNPNRGIGTTAGHAQMQQIWTKTVPSRLVAAKKGQVQVARMGQAPRMSVSTKTVAAGAIKPAKPAPVKSVQGAAPHRYVQIGTFGVPENARNTVARLRAIGLPVQMVNIRKGGKPLQIVVAGPFGSSAQLSNGLSVVRRAGFRDAFPRN